MKRKTVVSILLCALTLGTVTSCSQAPSSQTEAAAGETSESSGDAAEQTSDASDETSKDTSDASDGTSESTSDAADGTAQDTPDAPGETAQDTPDAADGTAEDTPDASNDSEDADSAGDVGAFSTTDVYGNPVDETIFADADLTLVNVFATWCGPCINELPELQKLAKELGGEGRFQVLGFVLDTVDAGFSQTSGTDEAIEEAQQLAEQTGCTFPFIIPDASGMNGRLTGINAVPESFFVDAKGNIVGETYVGARDYDTWASIVNNELESLGETP